MKEKHDVRARMEKIHRALYLHKMPRAIRLVVVTVIGGAVLAAGIVMIVTPGPAVVFIPLGLFLLASEFEWAQRWAQKLVDFLDGVRAKWRTRKERRSAAIKS